MIINIEWTIPLKRRIQTLSSNVYLTLCIYYITWDISLLMTLYKCCTPLIIYRTHKLIFNISKNNIVINIQFRKNCIIILQIYWIMTFFFTNYQMNMSIDLFIICWQMCWWTTLIDSSYILSSTFIKIEKRKIWVPYNSDNGDNCKKLII